MQLLIGHGQVPTIMPEASENNNIELDSADYYGGVESLMNPWDSARRVEQAIKDK